MIHNEYAKPSGEEHSVEGISELLKANGHKVFWFKRNSSEITGSFVGNFKAFLTGIHNPFAARALIKKLDEVKPDLVQVQNLYPLISPSIFKPLKERCIPVVMRCPNYRLFCPNGLHLAKGRICERCLGSGKELWCIFKNCENNINKSIGYALRNAFARMTRSILDGVDMFIVQTEFQKQKFIDRGIPADHIGIVPGFFPTVQMHDGNPLGDLITFVGRISDEKGIRDFLDAAHLMPNVPFAVAGACNHMPGILECAPSNVRWLGHLSYEQLHDIYLMSRIIVIPSRWYEGFPNVAVQAMAHARPIVAADIGALTSIVDENETGLLFESGNSRDLKVKLNYLYARKDICKMLGLAAQQKASVEYTKEKVYKLLVSIYDTAAQHCNTNMISVSDRLKEKQSC